MELCSEKRLGSFSHLKLQRAKPGTYAAVEKQNSNKKPEKNLKKKRQPRQDVGSAFVFSSRACCAPGLEDIEVPVDADDGCIQLPTRRRRE